MIDICYDKALLCSVAPQDAEYSDNFVSFIFVMTADGWLKQVEDNKSVDAKWRIYALLRYEMVLELSLSQRWRPHKNILVWCSWKHIYLR